jgi:hypothetical protein
MANSTSPIPQFPSHLSPHPTLGVRLRTRWWRDRLDDQLVSGADPTSSPELTLRAGELQSQAVRFRLANTIVARLAGASEHAEIREYADNLNALVARLRDDGPIDIQGAAMTARLVNDRTSPLHRHGGHSLRSAVLSARLALDRSARHRENLSSAA